MSEAPERIEIESECGHANTYNSEDRRTWLHFPDNAPDYFYAEYVRADRIEELEAKLAMAVEALEQIASHRKKCHEYDDDVGHERREFDVEDMIIMEYAARTTLAELKGGKDE